MATAMWLLLVALSVAGGECEMSGRPSSLLVSKQGNYIKTKAELHHTSESFLTTTDFLTKHGYPVETHTVTTEDGYLLTLHRIPGSPKAASGGVKAPVLAMHGASCASDAWVLAGPEQGLGFLLADEGYDVWLGNARGNAYSQKHKTLNNKDLGFYNYTFHEMGVYDLPAVIDYILYTTNHTLLYYIGHSMGCTIFFVMASSRPEYNKKIRLMVAMAPGVYVQGIKSPIKLFLPVVDEVYRGYINARENHIGLRQKPVVQLIDIICRKGNLIQEICIFCYSLIVGFNRPEMNMTLLPSLIVHTMRGEPLELMNHFAQLSNTGRFQEYHRTGNIYNIRPEYDLSKVTVPVSIHYSLGDFLIPVEGVKRLSQRLPNVVKLVQNPDKRASHIAFISSILIKETIYNEVMDLMGKH